MGRSVPCLDDAAAAAGILSSLEWEVLSRDVVRDTFALGRK
jgi:hypothetical protein